MRILLNVWLPLSCLIASSQAKTYDFPNPVDTKDREVSYQIKKTYEAGEYIYIDNQFDGARLNGLTVVNDSTFTILIEPENIPINFSPWYAFRLWSKEGEKNVTITLTYPKPFKHRYWPKVSQTSNEWSALDESRVEVAKDTLSATFSLNVSPDTTWIAAQPLETSKRVREWCEVLAKNKSASFDVIGKSRKGRDLFHVKLGKGKKSIVLLSRQHPPEVTGYYALKAFMNKLADNSKLSKAFLKEYTVHMYPLLNPDGVDLGHWRHNTGGVDLNRDWAYYNQAEVRQVANHIAKTVEENNGEVAVGLDFHSTYYDVYYTTSRSLDTNYPSFTDDWLDYIAKNIDGYEINDRPSGLGSPVSKGWFITQFNVPGITFEIGDDTPPEFIEKKGKVSAEGMMKVLMKE